MRLLGALGLKPFTRLEALGDLPNLL